LGYEQRFGGHIVTYADDLVICCKRGAEEALASMRQIMQRLRLTVNKEKTHVCCVPEQYFDFLGYQFGRFYSEATGKAYLGTRPSKKSVKRLIAAIHEQTTRKSCQLEAEEVVETLNRKLRGWANYFRSGTTSREFLKVDRYVYTRLVRWLYRRAGQRQGRWKKWTSEQFWGMGLYRLRGTVRYPAQAASVRSSLRRVRENRTHGLKGVC